MEEEVLNFIFPAPPFFPGKIEEYKRYLIHIPTQRKIKDKEKTEKIPCLFKKNKKSSNILIIFHCNGADMFDIFNNISEISEKHNINILIPEYPGYSIYKGHKSSEICLENSLIIYDFILKNIPNITEKNIYVLGRSLGTGPAVYLSSQRKPAGTFLISPYTTFAAVGKKFHTEEEIKILLNHFRSIDYIEKVNNPLLIIHGEVDNLIYSKEANELYDKCNKDIKKELKLIVDMSHNFGYHTLIISIIPLIEKFTEKYCPLTNCLDENDKNKIIIDFNKEYYDFSEDEFESESSDDFEFKEYN